MKKIYHKIKRFEQTALNCGPNSLAQLISFYDTSITPVEVISKTEMIENLGTWVGGLGKTAIKLGYKSKITPWSLYIFDPTWFKLKNDQIAKKLKNELKKEKGTLLRSGLKSYIDYFSSGGLIEFTSLSKELLIKKVQKYPILVGLSSTYLYRRKRNRKRDLGYRFGHFVVVNGYNPQNDKFDITDPWHSIPFSKTGRYTIKSDELINSMFFAEACHDCSILEIYK